MNCIVSKTIIDSSCRPITITGEPVDIQTYPVAELPLHKECSEKLVVGGYEEDKPPDQSTHHHVCFYNTYHFGDIFLLNPQ
jgi:hypothetical protein